MNIQTSFLSDRISQLEQVIQQIHSFGANSNQQIDFLTSHPEVQKFLNISPFLRKHLEKTDPQAKIAILSLLLLGQGPRVFKGVESLTNSPEITSLVDTLESLQTFYQPIGGILGYHLTFLKQLTAKDSPSTTQPSATDYLHPTGINLAEDTLTVREAIRIGIENLPYLAEVYPLGGAGDRLNLKDEQTGEALPAAHLKFRGRSLLEGLLRDIQGREFLFYQLFGRQITIPIAIMTSQEKNNHYHILQMFQQKHWFGRSLDSFRFFEQPLVPVLTEHGNWAMRAPLQLMLKPGGHGVIWKLGEENHIWEWLINQECRKLLVRQINNPVGDTDHGLLAFCGIGFKGDKTFGFASCVRRVRAAEGTVVLIEKKVNEIYHYQISNIEYTEFERLGISDAPTTPGGKDSLYPTNTNLLFVDIASITPLLKKCPFPGTLINMKSTVTEPDEHGNYHSVHAGRLECSMQNLSDFVIDQSPNPLKEFDSLHSFITFNTRSKTLSVTKKLYKVGQSPLETPEGCLYEQLINAQELLTKHCNFSVPAIPEEADYLQKAPPFLFAYHPGLGPLYSIIGQKLRGGRLNAGSELNLEIADLDCEDLDLQGSLNIHAYNPLGSTKNNLMTYGSHSGKCVLHRVQVRNRGINYKHSNIYWKNQIQRSEQLQICLQGCAEFFARDVILEGNFFLFIPNGYRLTVEPDIENQRWTLEKLDKPSWKWNYQFDADQRIQLSKEICH